MTLSTSGILAIAVAVALVLLLTAMVVTLLRRRGSRLRIQPIAPADVGRYNSEYAAIEADAVDRAQQAAGRARGLVEEVLRRMGFPDRVDSAQKAKDVAAYDRDVARVLGQADAAIRSAGTDEASLRHVVGLYRQALDGLLARTELENG